MNSLNKIILAAAAAAFFTSSPLSAQDNRPYRGQAPHLQNFAPDNGGGFRGRGGGEGRGRFLEELNLSQEQKEALKGMRENRQKMREARQDFREKRRSLNEEFKKDAFSEKDVLAKADEVNRKMVEMNNERIKNLITLRKTLSPEQFRKFRELMQKKRESMRERFGQGGPRGGFGESQGEGRFGGGFGGGPGGRFHDRGGEQDGGDNSRAGPQDDSRDEGGLF